jgi:hypothetical protein
MATASASPHKRVVVRVSPSASAKQERELGAFARYCVQRIEKDLGERQHWLVEITVGARGYSALVEVQHHGLAIETRGTGNDGALAIWDAMCRVEQELRDRRGSVFVSRPRVAND